MAIKRTLIITLLLLLLASVASAQNVWQVTGAIALDGDTIRFSYNGAKESARMLATDAPESSTDPVQPYGPEAKAYLASLIAGKTVTVKWSRRDQYKRILARLYIGDMDINLAMVRGGFAWTYLLSGIPAAERGAFDDAEKAARAGKQGLWALPNPIRPSDYRNNLKCKCVCPTG